MARFCITPRSVGRVVNRIWARDARSDECGVERAAGSEKGAALAPLPSVEKSDAAGGDLVHSADYLCAAFFHGTAAFGGLRQLPHGPAHVGLYGAGQLFFASGIGMAGE